MAKIKGIKKLNKVISAPLKKRFGIDGVDFSDEFNYTFTTNRIGYTLLENDLGDVFFNEFVKERFGYDVKYTFIISLLHEVGHAKNNEDIEGSVLDFCIAEKERISALIQATDDREEIKKLEFQYFNLPDEIMATSWAVNYAKKHPRICKKMWETMKAGFIEFYFANGLDLEEEGD
jgi:hypothetical protein